MQYLKLFDTHAEYAEYIDSQDAVIPNVSYCANEKEVHNKSKYTLTIVFSFDEDFGRTPPPNFVGKYINGAEYNVSVPQTEGCTPSVPNVTGIMPAHDLTINVVYSRNTYKITATYLYQDGSQAFRQQVLEYKYAEEYNIIPPEIPNYIPTPMSLSGTMIARNFPVRFMYVYVTPDDPDTPI